MVLKLSVLKGNINFDRFAFKRRFINYHVYVTLDKFLDPDHANHQIMVIRSTSQVRNWLSYCIDVATCQRFYLVFGSLKTYKMISGCIFTIKGCTNNKSLFGPYVADTKISYAVVGYC